MRILNRKLRRDLVRMWSQGLTIALVVACGMGSFLTSLSAVGSLTAARDRFYQEGRFGDLFAAFKNAPLSLIPRLREAPGIAEVQVTVEQLARVEIPGLDDPVIGQMIGLDRRLPRGLNRVVLAAGRPLSPQAQDSDREIETLVSEAFAQARGLRPGSVLRATLNGKPRTLRVVGVALSPEHIFAGLWGMPDARGYGVFWMDRAVLAGAYNMEGSFNRASFALAPGAVAEQSIDALARLLAPYGAREVLTREHQVSHAMLTNEIEEQRLIGTLIPGILLGVAAFLLNVVVARLVATQREQIATLKALGYRDGAISAHYLAFVLIIVAFGMVLGALVGKELGYLLTRLYAEIFHFPVFAHRLAPGLLLQGVAVCTVTAVLGTLFPIVRTARLPPAEAMRPPAPPVFRPTLLERLGITTAGTTLRMILRNLERRLARTALAIAAVAAAVAVVILGNFFRDAIAMIIDNQFRLGLRGDLTFWTDDPVTDHARFGLERLPGVRHVESLRFISATVSHLQRRERIIIRGYAGRAELYRVIDGDQRETVLEGRGLVLTERLAEKLRVRPGDPVHIETLEGRQRSLVLPLRATVDELFGLNAYLDRRSLNALLADPDVSTGFVVAVDPGREAAVMQASRAMPRIAGAWSKATMLHNMEAITARNVRIISSILTAFASVIAVGVVYNNMRIALSERAWELASLRVLGFTRAEVAAMLLGEMAIVIAIALPFGMALGHGLVSLIAELMKSDQLHFPVVILPRTYAWAALSVMVAGAASASVAWRHIGCLDLVAALKARE
jgi:putative ABC transport system permease protein